MSTLSLRLPESLHKELRELSKREGISINQLAAAALGEKMAVLMTQDYLEEKAKRGSRKKFDQALTKVKDGKPESRDQL